MVIAFTKVHGPYGWLGNMAPFPILYNGKVYPTTEHLFQSLRLPPNHHIINEANEHNSPMYAKMVLKKYSNDFIVAPRSDKDIENMFFVIDEKIKQHPELKIRLIGTGNERIIEDVTLRRRKDLFWGAAFINNVWQGKNILGHIWMLKRDELI